MFQFKCDFAWKLTKPNRIIDPRVSLFPWTIIDTDSDLLWIICLIKQAKTQEGAEQATETKHNSILHDQKGKLAQLLA